MRTKKAIYNTVSSLALELITIIVGLIVPRMILSVFGSTYNGVITSITHFLSFVSLLRAGMGGATRAALYKPLAEEDRQKISSVVKATENFMRKVAWIFAGSILVFACVYPLIVNEFEWLFTFILVLILGIDSFCNYYFGITYQILLIADQREYIFSTIKIITTILTGAMTVLFIQLGCGIHLVKLAAALAGLFSPLMLHIYVRRRYRIDNKAKPDFVAINQRWNVFIHQIANYVHSNTDVLLLTLLAGDIKIISVYMVYSLVVSKIKTLVTALTNGVEAALGNMIAKKETTAVRENFKQVSCVVSLISNFLFGCVGALILSFVQVYTKGVTDVNYFVPAFAMLFVAAEYVYCIRIPYVSVIQASGHYKQTQNSAIIEAVINLLLSVCLVYKFGLIGVAVGTLAAMIYRTTYLVIYAQKNILHGSAIKAGVQAVINFIATGVIAAVPLMVGFTCVNYAQWFGKAVLVALWALSVSVLLALVVYKQQIKKICKRLIGLLKK